MNEITAFALSDSLFSNSLGTGTEGPSLAPQELRLLSLLAEGYSYQDAADAMIVSVNTVRNYIRSSYEKLQVHTKAAAVSKALRWGLI